MNEELRANSIDVTLEDKFRNKRAPRSKRMSGELATDSRPVEPVDRFRINVFRRAIDQIITSIDSRFLVNLPLIKDTSCLDPRHFDELRKNGIPRQSLEQVGKLTGLNPTDLRSELAAFVRLPLFVKDPPRRVLRRSY